MVELAEAVEAGRVHMVSSIAAAGLYKGTWREDMFEEAQDLDTHPYFRTKHESEGVVRNECERPVARLPARDRRRPLRDRRDGQGRRPLLLLQADPADPQRGAAVDADGRESRGGEINIVPVDFVVKAMDHIAHPEGLDGKAFHLTDPNPLTAGEVIDIFARAAHAPQTSVRLPAGAIDGAAADPRRWSSTTAPLADSVADARPRRLRHPALGPDLRQLPDPLRLAPDAGGARGHRDRGAAAGGLRGQALGLLGAPPRPRPLPRPHAGRRRARAGSGSSAGSRQIIEQQIPDELMRLGRRLRGDVSLEEAVRGRMVMVTGASSGIGKSAAMKIADAGGTVLLVARTPGEARGDQGADRGRRRGRPHPPLRPLRLRGHRPDGGGGARPARPRRRPRQQRRALDPALGRALLRPPARLRAHDPAQLPRARCG